MREIDEIVLHYSATPEGQEFHVDDIRRWHKARGFNDVGYHYVITLDGDIELGRPLDVIGAHVKNHNTGKIGVCYIGGTDEQGKAKDTMTKKQQEAFMVLVISLRVAFQKHLTIKGHKDFVPTGCPGFNVREKFRSLV